MEKIINPIKKEKLIADLKSCKFIKMTNRRGNEIYSFSYRDAQSIMYEVGRLRETAFRLNGCGSGNIIDLDKFDMEPLPYRQLIVWNPRDKEIIGGYRYAVGRDYLFRTDLLSMSHFFRFSKKFVLDYLPYSIELGSEWVNPLYQMSTNDSGSIFSLDNLWEGIGAVVAENKNVRFLIGKVTMPETYNSTARILISWFMSNYYADRNNLVVPFKPIILPRVLSIGGRKITGCNAKNDFKIISSFIKSRGLFVPPLISAYLRLAKNMVSFGSTLNPELENSYETGIMIEVNDIYPEKSAPFIQVSQHIESVYR
jgi:hypothetical protein